MALRLPRPLPALRLAALLLLLLMSCAPRERAAQLPPASNWGGRGQGNLSPGCSKPGVGPATRGLAVAGAERSFLVRVPDSYTPQRPHDLIIAFHGRTNPNAQVRGYFGLDEASPESIIVYPSALSAASGFRWSDPGDLPGELRDFALVEALVTSFGAAYCLDLGRIFVVGHSLGASFANSVACHRGELIRAVATVAGGIAAGNGCDGRTAALIIHHPDDRLVPISEGLQVRDAFLGANHLPAEAVPASEPELAELSCLRYGPDSPDPVLWCAHDDATTRGGRYYPHNWPDAAAAAIARFFRDLP